MIIKEKLGNLTSFSDEGRVIDRLPLEWYETGKRILHKRTGAGREVIMKFMKEAQTLEQDDVLYADDRLLIVVEITPCDAIVLRPSTMYEMAFVCYEIGNKHLPLFFEDDALLIPFEAPIFRLLQAQGLNPEQGKRKLLHQLRTTVSAHEHTNTRASLFSKILQITTPSTNG